MARFVTFPGGGGSFASTDDVNLLDADTAHIQQSIGGWKSRSQAANFMQDTEIAPVFGDFLLSFTRSSATVTCAGQTATGLDGVPVSADTEYTASFVAASQTAAATCEAKIQWFDAAGASISTTSEGTVVPVAGTTLLLVSKTATSPPLAAFATVEAIFRSAAFEVGEKQFIDTVTVRAGADPAFVPSLRIVGDYDMRVQVSPNSGVLNATSAELTGFHTDQNTVGYRTVYNTTADRMTTFFETATSGISTQWNNSYTVGVNQLHRWTRVVSTGIIEHFIDGVSDDTQGPFNAGEPIEYPAGMAGRVGGWSARGLDADVYSMQVLDGLDGPVVMRFDPDDISI